MNKKPLVTVRNLTKIYNAGKSSEFKAVDEVSFDIYQGETFGLAGESGSGKTTTGKMIMKLENVSDGKIVFLGKDVNTIKKRKELLNFRRNVQMIFQDPFASLNPRLTVKEIIGGPLQIHHMVSSRRERDAEVRRLLEIVGLNANFADRYPTEFSGGQCQRIDIARALALKPKFIIADEAISALDVSIQAQIVNLLQQLKREQGLTYLFIAHDLSMVKYISDRIAVMNHGRIMELADSDELYRNPLHPYTISLLSAVPAPNPLIDKLDQRISYNEDSQQNSTDMKLREIQNGHFVYCSEGEVEAYKRKYWGVRESRERQAYLYRLKI